MSVKVVMILENIEHLGIGFFCISDYRAAVRPHRVTLPNGIPGKPGGWKYYNITNAELQWKGENFSLSLCDKLKFR